MRWFYAKKLRFVDMCLVTIITLEQPFTDKILMSDNVVCKYSRGTNLLLRCNLRKQ